MSVSPANAEIATAASGTRAFVSHNSNAVPFDLCNIHYNFEQRMTINGQSMMVLIRLSTYEPGAYDLTLVGTCEGFNIYELSSSNGLTVDFPNPSITNRTENASTEITKPAAIWLIAAPEHRDYLWIRKKN